MSTFTQELLQTGIYKRSQGRITRQVTFAVIALVFAAGCLRVSQIMSNWRPEWALARPAEALYVGDSAGRVAADAVVEIAGNRGKATVTAAKGESLEKLVQRIDSQRRTTGVAAVLDEGSLRLRSDQALSTAFVQVRTASGEFSVQGVDAQGKAVGRDETRMGLHLLVPGLLLALGIWVAYRLVNMASFADFLIAVEAEMNKVSWPSRGELIRASAVVLVTMLVLAGVLFFFDVFWQRFFLWLGIIG